MNGKSGRLDGARVVEVRAVRLVPVDLTVGRTSDRARSFFANGFASVWASAREKTAPSSFFPCSIGIRLEHRNHAAAEEMPGTRPLMSCVCPSVQAPGRGRR